MNRIERAKRDAQVLQLFIGGATYRSIAEALEMSAAQVDRVVKRELAKASKRRDLLADEALSVFIERSEVLWKAHYPKAVRGDYKSSVICDRVLARQARLFGLIGGEGSAGAHKPDEPDPDPLGDEDDDAEDGDELERFRRRRRA